ncbi:hypothetical protein GUITHDRAFT_116517 [Guillardia theta CCMP2712]|uniref:Uncharacterized protein n=1 Tax=Guillardia theta (strain CCMP2712) TaxID=905079 RepID=L1IMT4_GUITC|nr:hypothetical protein GUITHDRAFT_116517 [Guillardia theta CCMP2712]EKX37402.1 hypothetical protein GUITHDRAFT_116517 [Guillardia theta CCMP2712]|eukprot:XP_005824382.1 hypothetical protein GUITHDRAFT_116517 [Guillardia theta CCMP2712]
MFASIREFVSLQESFGPSFTALSSADDLFKTAATLNAKAKDLYQSAQDTYFQANQQVAFEQYKSGVQVGVGSLL